MISRKNSYICLSATLFRNDVECMYAIEIKYNPSKALQLAKLSSEYSANKL